MREDDEDGMMFDRMLELLERKAPRPLSIQDIARLLELESYDRKAMRSMLEAQVGGGRLRRIGKTRYQWLRPVDKPPQRPAAPLRPVAPSRRSQRGHRRVEGRYSRVRQGYGFVEVLGRAADEFPRDIRIPEGREGTALHGDRVIVEIVRHDRRTQRIVGQVVEVVHAVHESVIGTLELSRRGWHLIPSNELLPIIELIGDAPPQRTDEGRVALARITRPGTATRPPGGVLVEIVGDENDPRVQFLGIAFEHGLRTDFSAETLAEAAGLPEDPSPADLDGREDLRDLPFVTIDGETARDFDDAVCLEPSRGGSRLYVAIADVSHYVRPGSALDREAAARGTSVYFPDRAIPMLPEQLSNRLCSLNPQRDRLVLVAEIDLDGGGRERAARFYRGVIRSRARLTYTRVAAVLSDARTPEIEQWREELGDLVPQLHAMHALMRILYRQRIEAGSLDLDLPEALVDLSEEGRSVGVRLFARNDAHRIIEELMLAANRAVASYLRERDIPFPYRIHEPPDPADIDELNRFLGSFGMVVKYRGKVRPADVQELLGRLGEHRLSRVLSRLVLRSLTQAQYSTRNVGHFGLAFPIYCHFTSPIRRYPDLLVHRQLGRLFDGRVEEARAEAEMVEQLCVQSSQNERQAMEAERAMLDLKKAEFMLGHLLEPHRGTIVSATKFGLFVELEAYPVEGLVRCDALPGDRYRLIEAEHALQGVRTRRRFRLGDRLVVEATDVSLRRRQIDFALTEADAAGAAAPARQRHRRSRKSRREHA
jgi:ribonuclease R